jgi:hypothetical protein
MEDKICINNVWYYKEQPSGSPLDEKYKNLKDQVDWLVTIIEQNQHDAQGLYDDCNKHKLTAGLIDAEGYLRCAISIKEQTYDILEITKETE